MNLIMITGMVATFVGALWAKYEQEEPNYWAFWGISHNTANIIKIGTTALFPGGYLLILLAPGSSWLFNIGMVVVMHFVGIQVLAGLASGVLSGVLARRRMREDDGVLVQDDDD